MKNIFKVILFLTAIFALFSCKAKQAAEQPRHPEWSYNAVIYELNTRQFTPEGTFTAAARHLDRLKSLEVDIIWFMPIQPIGEHERKGELGSYYSISDYKAVNPEFGTIDDFKAFVKGAHDRGMKVILDWVANHTSRDAVWLKEGKQDWYVISDAGVPVAPFDWTDVAKLNYENKEMREEMAASMMYWISEVGLDGFRCDVADQVPTDFWEDVVARLKEVRPDLFMLAEAEKTYLHNKAFDMTYAWELHHLMNKIALGEKNADDLRAYYVKEDKDYPEDAFRMLFTSNHDENSWNGTEFERMGRAAKTFAALTYVLPGMPLIYNGQEVGFDRRLEFFEKDSINWDGDKSFTELYTRLGKMRHANKALESGERGGRLAELKNDAPGQVYSFERSRDGNTVVAVFNLSAEPVTVKISAGNASGEYTDVLNDGKVTLGDPFEAALAPWQYNIYVR